MLIVSLKLSNPSPWHRHRHNRRQEQPKMVVLWNLKSVVSRRQLQCKVFAAPLTKQGQQFISRLELTSEAKTANRLINKFVGSSPKSIALNALSYLLSPHIASTRPSLSSHALPLYSRISEATWFNWNPKLIAELIALLGVQEQHQHSETLISEAISKLQCKERDIALFYCNLIESQCKHKSEQGFSDSYVRLRELVDSSSSVYVKSQGYKSMVGSLCEMGRPHEAEDVIEEMKNNGIKLSSFEFRSVLYGYGRLGLFEDMSRVVDQMQREGLEIDVVSSNMVLSSYGAHNALSEMVLWVQKMKSLGIPFSERTYNSILNSCPNIMSMLQDLSSLPLSIEELMENLNGDEELLVKELVDSSVLSAAMEWGASEVKLDLHGMHLGSAFLTMLEWMEEMRNRFKDENCLIPLEITVVCGSGKHSIVRGESPVKAMVREIMFRTRSPMRIDRKNVGCFIAKGKTVKEWLC